MLVAAAAVTGYSIIAIVGGILGIIGLLGAAWAIFRANLATATITLLKDNAEALKTRVEELTTQNSEQAATIAHQSQELKVLREQVSGAKAIQALSEKIDEHHRQLIEAIGRHA